MIHYPYECPNCDHFVLEPASWFAEHKNCPECNAVVEKVPGAVHRRGLDPVFRKPIEMFSVAPETPDQMAALRKARPETQFTDQGVPLARTRTEKLAILKAVGYEEH